MGRDAEIRLWQNRLALVWFPAGKYCAWPWMCMSSSFSMWKWCPVFTVRDLALLSSRWSHPASERCPLPESPDLSLFSLLLSLPLPLFLLNFYLSYKPNLLLLCFGCFMSGCLPLWTSFSSVITFPPLTPASYLSLVHCLSSPFPPSSVTSFIFLISPHVDCVVECQRGKTRPLCEGNPGSTSPHDPCFLWSAQ